MKIQINPTQTQEIKSFKSVKFINKEDLQFQLSIIHLGLKYNRHQQMNVRTLKDYDKLNRQMEILFDLDLKISKLLESFDFEKQQNKILNYSI